MANMHKMLQAHVIMTTRVMYKALNEMFPMACQFLQLWSRENPAPQCAVQVLLIVGINGVPDVVGTSNNVAQALTGPEAL